MNKTSGSAKRYIIFDSNNDKTYDIVSLAEFCRNNNLSEPCLRDASSIRRQAQHKGFFAKEYGSDRNLENEYAEWLQKRTPKARLTKQEIYGQTDKCVYFYNNAEKIYHEYHIEKKLSCREIGELFDTNSECVRLKFKSLLLPVINYPKNQTGSLHHRFRSMDALAQDFVNNFEAKFNHHHRVLKEPINIIAKTYNLSSTTIFNHCRKLKIPFDSLQVTTPHFLINEYLKKLGIDFIVNDRKAIAPKELDIYIPSHNLAIEINGIYWHSDENIHRNYHLEKLELCENKNIKLLQFWDYEILDNFNLVSSIILANFGKSDKIYARKTHIKDVEYKDVHAFLKDNHIQGPRTTHMNYGLYDDNENLKMVATFIKHKKYEYELARMCTDRGLVVVGGAQKLLNHFITKINPSMLMSFCDRRLFTGRVYEKTGFEFVKNTAPNYWYWKDSSPLESRQKYQKHKLHKKLEIFDENLSEYKNMRLNGYMRVFDCGNKMYIKQNLKSE